MTVTVPGPARNKTKRRPPIEVPEPDTGQPPNPTERRDGRPRSAAAQRAYARRAQRTGGAAERFVPEPEPSDEPTGGRARFVVLIIGLLVVGIAATLWLSTQAIADSYRLERIKQQSTDLSERADVLQREVTRLDSPAALAKRAEELGMVFPGEPAWLVVHPDGTISLFGEPKPATAPAPPPPPADAAQAEPLPAPLEGERAQTPGAGDPAQTAGDGDPAQTAGARPAGRAG
ncbi:MAG TPA: septum formation initiator family protein [Actinophytocola sp.]|uniref:FtsB family cell division protein n=1 Tax=Actinophytocola sp. TaxID=1872138 RepID=UPI002DB9053F|nr:septum formation initiator family protein [Actinophytocola sp.]HEU5471529.1 septum formation initiator family protein [Actinophytocola sp.]